VKFATLPVRNIARRPVRSTLTVAGIAVAVAAFVALTGMSRALEGGWVRSLVERDTHLMALRKGAVEILTTTLDESLTTQIKEVSGVRDVAGELVDLVTVPTGQAVLMTGWPDGSFLWQTLPLRDGRVPAADEGRWVIVGEPMAEHLGVRVGDAVAIRGAPFTVAAISQPKAVLNRHALVAPLRAMQRLLDRPGRVTIFNVRLSRPDDPAAVADTRARLSARFPDVTFTESGAVAQQNEILSMLRAVAWGTSTIALLMGLLAVLNTLLMAVTERSREIALLSAMGWPQERVLWLILLEGLVLALVGSGLGTALGVGALHGISRHESLRAFLEIQVGPELLWEVVASGVALGGLGGLYPAWRAVRQPPAEVLQRE
jgi:putative ABC transport system permease protein